jgi:hypothetical protein
MVWEMMGRNDTKKYMRVEVFLHGMMKVLMTPMVE